MLHHKIKKKMKKKTETDFFLLVVERILIEWQTRGGGPETDFFIRTSRLNEKQLQRNEYVNETCT